MEGIIMADYPNNVVDGQELPASTVNQILAARVGDIKPIDATTRNYTDQAGELGTSTYTFEKGNIADLTIVTDTIGTTTTNGAIALAPDGTGRVENDRILGTQTIDNTQSTYVKNVAYLADKDLFISCVYYSVGDAFSGSLSTGATSTPTDIISQETKPDGYIGSVCGFIKKGNYWQITELEYGWAAYTIIVTELGA